MSHEEYAWKPCNTHASMIDKDDQTVLMLHEDALLNKDYKVLAYFKKDSLFNHRDQLLAFIENENIYTRTGKLLGTIEERLIVDSNGNTPFKVKGESKEDRLKVATGYFLFR